MNRPTFARLFPLAALFVIAGCSSGGDTGSLKTGGDFVVLRTEPAQNGTLFLNEPISIDFSTPVDLDTVDLQTFTFLVLDQLGNELAEPPAGSFRLATSPGDTEVGRRLQFVPRLPTNDSFTNGGFRPGRTYVVQLVGGDRVNGTVLRDTRGRGLELPQSFTFKTADSTSLDQLFRNTVGGGPRRTSLTITPTPDASGVVLNKLGTPPVEIRLGFDQALNPNSSNVPVAIPIDPTTRDENNKGRIYLEYDDPGVVSSTKRWIPAVVELEENTFSGSTVLMRPLGVLPNNAEIRVIVDLALEDISGESNLSNPAYNPTFGSFRTRRSYEQQFDALVEEFTNSNAIDFAAAFSEPLADVGPGYIKAGFGFDGSSTTIDFDPVAQNTVLNTNFTQVVPKLGSAYNVSGGVFNFRSVNIAMGKTVLGQGSNPMVWLVSETFNIDGTLSVQGGNGERVESTGNADVAKAGGIGVCGGGDGGAGSPSTTQRDEFGGKGRGPLQVNGGGGAGGLLSCAGGCLRGSGGGGGALATQGDPNYKQKVVPVGAFPPNNNNERPIFQQQTGVGGFGCVGQAGTLTRSLNGGSPGPVVFTDARLDNNYWGSAIDFNRRLRITGELSVPVGGGGGGGGGDLSYNTNCSTDEANFLNDSSGGGGGGGGGVLIVKALGEIVIGSTGRITADGGNGGGGEASGASSKAGGGGGGAGGMVILMSASRIVINARGTGANFTYAANDYTYSISADGGICRTAEPDQTTGPAPFVRSKYPASGTAIATTFMTTYDSAPLGGFGGMGIVQLMTPPGTNTDGTNTVLDDNITVLQNGATLSGAQKQAMLAWRGIPDQFGVGRNDTGGQVTIGDAEGDIRPAPILMPVPFGAKTRLRSRWIDTGASQRRALATGPDELPRGIDTSAGDVTGPWYEFQGVDATTGYANFTESLGRGVVDYGSPTIAATTIASVSTNATFQGASAYRVELSQPVLGAIADRYVHYEAEALNAAGTKVGSFAILSHTNRVLLLSPAGGAFPTTAARMQVRAKFFKVITAGLEGLGGTYPGTGGAATPIANVRIGFAFHDNPKSSQATRVPALVPGQPETFLYDLSDPAVQEQIRALGLTFVQWDVVFDGAFKPGSANPPEFGPSSPRPELHWLRLPFRF
ncbi:MAG: hypothetical protein JNL08_20205 [Planctomycetes bacterium]|nr:hypothetical protein [Planctomycetota bacterium]